MIRGIRVDKDYMVAFLAILGERPVNAKLDQIMPFTCPKEISPGKINENFPLTVEEIYYGIVGDEKVDFSLSSIPTSEKNYSLHSEKKMLLLYNKLEEYFDSKEVDMDKIERFVEFEEFVEFIPTLICLRNYFERVLGIL